MRQLLAAATVATLILVDAMASDARISHDGRSVTRAVSGKAVHYSATSMIHSETSTPTGKVLRSTDIVELTGDLEGRVLYQPISVIDTVKGTLMNTGNQVFSGTVVRSEPVLLHDDRFRFEADLKGGGKESGEVHLSNRLAGPAISCDLVVTGTGKQTAEGNGIVEYRGTCKIPR